MMSDNGLLLVGLCMALYAGAAVRPGACLFVLKRSGGSSRAGSRLFIAIPVATAAPAVVAGSGGD